MLKNHVIEEIVDASMAKFSSEHEGEVGWSKEDITKKVYKTVLVAVEQGCEVFYTGAMGRFD